MKRELRLRSRVDFQRVRDGRRSWSNSLLVLYAIPNHLPHIRLGVSVAKRVDKRAVLRNRVRRRVREAVRLRLERIAPGSDLLFIARASCAQADWPALDGAVEHLLRRGGLLRDVPAE